MIFAAAPTPVTGSSAAIACADCASHCGKTGQVSRGDRLLDELQPEALELAYVLDGFFAVPRLVGIQPQQRVWTDRVAHRPDQRGFGGEVAHHADLEFYAAKAAIHRAARRLRRRLRRVRGNRGINRHQRPPASAEQFCHWDSGLFREQIASGDIQSATDRRARLPAA